MKNSAIGGTWKELQEELFTPEEITASNLRISLIGKSMTEKQKAKQRKIEK